MSMKSVYHRCPMCGTKKGIHVVRYNGCKLATADDKDNICCTLPLYYNHHHLDEMNTYEGLSNIDMEMESEALAVTDEHGYFMDYGPCDSDPYD